MAILSFVRQWEPFQIDALGVVTLLGAESLEKALGRLVVTPLAEYFPLLAAQVVLEGTLAEPIPGFVIYNITDDIKATSVNAWWTRWLLCQDLSDASTTFELNTLPSPRRHATRQYVSMFTAALVNVFLTVFPILLGDWYAFACAISVTIDVMLRTAIMGMYRDGLDDNLREAKKSPKPVKLIITLPSGRLVTVYTTRGIAIKGLLTEVKPTRNHIHAVFRNVSWLSFGVYIVTLGMSCLTMQLIFVACILIPSAMVIKRVGCDEYHVGSLLEIHRSDLVGAEHRARTLAALRLSGKEEQAMIDWEFFPRRTNTRWWEQYRTCEKEFLNNPYAFDGWHEKLARKSVTHTIDSSDSQSDA